jgi:hypothetical protein
MDVKVGPQHKATKKNAGSRNEISAESEGLYYVG